MMGKRFFIFLFLAGAELPSPAGDIPVLLRVPRAEQHDTTGWNIVNEVTKFVYDLVLSNKIKLWDSRTKDIQITGATLLELEKTSKTVFTQPEVMYMYENWNKTLSGINSQTLGFMFLNRNALGEEVSYGYVDYNDLKTSFIRSNAATNPNLNSDLSLALLLYKKMFYFNIIQFGGKTVSTGAGSNEIKSEFIAGPEFNPAIKWPDAEERELTYIVEDKKTSDDENTANSLALLKSIEQYLTGNEEEFFNIGGERLMSFINRKKRIRVTRLLVQENWKKKNGVISMETKSITVFVNDSALNEVYFNNFLLWGIFLNDQSMYEVFKEKKFTFFITRINAWDIPRKNAYSYYKALMSTDWRRLTEYVKRF